MSNMPNTNDLTVGMHKVTNGIKILINPVLAVGDMMPDSCHYYQLHLETLVVLEKKGIH